MLTEELRQKLMKMIRENPGEAMAEIQKDPNLLKILLTSETELKKTKEELNNERIKYVNMTQDMQTQLKQTAERLNTTQGVLIGVGVILLLEWLSRRR